MFSGEGFRYMYSNVSFLFSLKNKDNVPPFKAPVKFISFRSPWILLVSYLAFVLVMICSSVMTLIPINNHTPTLATNINLQQGTSGALNKPNPFLLEVFTLHQLKLKYFIKLNNTADHKLNPKKLKEIKEQEK